MRKVLKLNPMPNPETRISQVPGDPNITSKISLEEPDHDKSGGFAIRRVYCPKEGISKIGVPLKKGKRTCVLEFLDCGPRLIC